MLPELYLLGTKKEEGGGRCVGLLEHCSALPAEKGPACPVRKGCVSSQHLTEQPVSSGGERHKNQEGLGLNGKERGKEGEPSE